MIIIEEIERKFDIKFEINDTNTKQYHKNSFTLNDKEQIDHITIYKGINDKNSLDFSKTLKSIKSLNSIDLRLEDVTNASFLSDLENLESLTLKSNNLKSLSFLKGLKNLTTLNLSGSKINDFSSISSLENITNLELANCNLINIDPLKNLINLKRLFLLENQIVDLTPIKNLKNLEIVNLGHNKFDNISSLENLENLNSLWLIGNLNVKDFFIISKLKNLENLSLGRCNIENIDFLKPLTKLKRLDLQDNKIENITIFKNFKEIEKLNIKKNIIKKIDSIKHLKNIKTLQLQYNPISLIPIWITDMGIAVRWNQFGYGENLITFFENPIKNIPIETIKQGNDAIDRYFNKIENEGYDYIYEVKITLVGEGNAGKTSLLRRLSNITSSLPRKDNRTRGINIKDWYFKKNKDKKHIAHIWDFGGQDVYYPVHRFFITENSIFILLASTRQTHHNFDYWIPTIHQFGEKSPIILGQTCHDGNKKPWNDLDIYLGNTNFNIIKTQNLPYYEINLPNDNTGLAKIKSVIVDQINNLPHYGRKVPKSWAIIRNKLKSFSKNHPCISYEKLKQFCDDVVPESFNNANDYSDFFYFLHDIGVILWYSNNVELKNWIMLEPQWAMNAVYKIIDDSIIQKRNGNIIKTDFNRLWKEETYLDKHNILKNMFKVFKIAFPKKHKKEEYIIPARLKSMPSNFRFKEENYLCLDYHFDFMPRGIVNQLSAELSKYITDENLVWNNAVNFTLEKFNNAQVEEDFYNRKITIKVEGKDSRSLLVLIKNSLEDITEEYKGVFPKILVPCYCNYCKSKKDRTKFSYEKLSEWYGKSRDNVTCNESGESLLIEKLLYNVGLDVKNNDEFSIEKISKAKKVFISYSKFDKKYLQSFEDHLVTLKKEGIATFNCQQIDFGDKWDNRIKKEIDECDIMICLISVKFLNTDYITKIEIPKAIEQNKIIIPIVIKSCDWENSDLGVYQAAQRGQIVSLDNDLRLKGEIKGVSEEEQDAFWTNIVKELRVKVFD